MKFLQFLLVLTVSVASLAQGGGVTPAELLKPLKDSWPTYNGDYSGRRFSALNLINTSTVKHLSLAWSVRYTPGMPPTAGAKRGRFGGGTPTKLIVGGEGTGELAAGGGTIKASLLAVNGTLYFTMPDNAWAVNARDGQELWHYYWKTCGMAIWNN